MIETVKAMRLPPVAMTDLGYTYCQDHHQPEAPVEWLTVGPQIEPTEKCETCGREFGSLPLVEVEAWAIVEYVTCRIF